MSEKHKKPSEMTPDELLKSACVMMDFGEGTPDAPVNLNTAFKCATIALSYLALRDTRLNQDSRINE